MTFKAIADRFGAQLRLTRLRPSGRGADVWDELHPTAAQQRELYDWLVAHGEQVLTGDSFFHLAALRRRAARAEPVRGGPGGLPDRPGRRRLRLPVRHPRRTSWPATSAIAGGFATVWRESELFAGPAPAADRRRLPRRARPTTPAAAGAWRPSSSPGCRWTARTPSASRATASARWRRRRRRGARAAAVRRPLAPLRAVRHPAAVHARCRSRSAGDRRDAGPGVRREPAGRLQHGRISQLQCPRSRLAPRPDAHPGGQSCYGCVQSERSE